MFTIRCMYCGSFIEEAGPYLTGVTCSGFCATKIRLGVYFDFPIDNKSKKSRKRTRNERYGRLHLMCMEYYNQVCDERFLGTDLK